MSVLVLSWDRIGAKMAGSAIRALEMARALARHGLPVILAAPEGSVLEGSGSDANGGIAAQGQHPLPELVTFPAGDLPASLIGSAEVEVVVVSGRVELLPAVKKPLVVDLYDPFVLSNLELFGDDFNRAGGRALLSLRWLQHHLAHGDFFLCASAAQRSFWLGMLAASGRVNRANALDDADLNRLLAIVPFGVPDEPPSADALAIRGKVPGVGPQDRVLLWAGGMWNWFDPLTLIRATARLRARRSDVTAVLLGGRHPNPEIGEMEMAREARRLAQELGVEGQGVSFVDWVPYAERQRWVLDSDVGVSLHRSGLESEFAFRTRVLDYIWCARPMVVTAGDDLAVRVAADRLGVVVAPGDVDAVEAAFEQLLDDPEADARRQRIEALRAELTWSRVVAPLVEFCRAPRHAPDRRGDAWIAAGAAAKDLPQKSEALVADEHVSDARALSPELDGRYSPRQRFTAAYPNLCQIDVLFWVEPPMLGAKVLFELFAADSDAALVRVVVPASALPLNDWQRFEFRPQPHSRGQEFEFRLTLITPERGRSGAGGATAGGASDAAAAVDARASADVPEPLGRVCLWRCAPPPGVAAEGEGIAFIARYLIDHVASDVPVADETFLFAHDTTVPLARSQAAGVLSHEVEVATGGPAAADVARFRVELARVAAQAAAAELRAIELARELEKHRFEIAQHTSEIAQREARLEIAKGHYLAGVLEETLAALLGLARLAKRGLGVLLILLLTLASLPLAILVGAGILVCDLLTAARRRRARRYGAASEDVSGNAAPHPRPDGAVSVVIPTWNGRELLEMSLPPLLEAMRRHGHADDEIIVVDNGSEDDTVAWLEERAREAPLVRTIALSRNEGFAGATNRGAAAARNPTLILLNNDMVVEPDFVQPLLDAFAAEPDAFGVSCQIDFIDPSKPRWETGKVHGEMRLGTLRLFHLDRFDEDLIYPVLFAGGGASAYDRAKFMALGGFDEAVFSPVYIEDVDLGYRAWKRGWPSVLAPRSMVHHKHRGTTRRLWSEAMIASFFRKNLAALLWKNFGSWRLLSRHLAGLLLLPWRLYREEGGRVAVATFRGMARQLVTTLRARAREAAFPVALTDEEILHVSRHRYAYRAHFHAGERDSSATASATALAPRARAASRPQVLVIAPYSPVPAVHGGAVRMLNLIRAASERCDVTLISFMDTAAEGETKSLAALRDLCRDAILVPRDLHGHGGRLAPIKTRGFFSTRMAEQIEYWLDHRHFDVVQVEYTHMAHFLPPPTPGMLRVLVEHDLTFVAQARARHLLGGSIARRLTHWLDELRTLRQEIGAVESADVVLTMSEDDRRTLARFVDPAHVVVVPNGVSCDDFPFRPEEAEPATILFVGFFRHEPNVEAVRYFATEVLPLVRKQVPEAIFRVVGAYPPPSLVDLAGSESGIELTGMVPETASHYRRATVFVAPVLRGSGTRLKILEAFASGCAVVSTTIGAEGLGASADEIRIADEPEAFARAIVELIRDPAARRAMAESARRFAEERFDWSVIARRQLEAWGIEVASEVEAAA